MAAGSFSTVAAASVGKIGEENGRFYRFLAANGKKPPAGCLRVMEGNPFLRRGDAQTGPQGKMIWCQA